MVKFYLDFNVDQLTRFFYISLKCLNTAEWSLHFIHYFYIFILLKCELEWTLFPLFLC